MQLYIVRSLHQSLLPASREKVREQKPHPLRKVELVTTFLYTSQEAACSTPSRIHPRWLEPRSQLVTTGSWTIAPLPQRTTQIDRRNFNLPSKSCFIAIIFLR